MGLKTLVNSKNISDKFLTALNLGFDNIATVLLYRAASRWGMIEKLMPCGEGYCEPLFVAISAEKKSLLVSDPSAVISLAGEILAGRLFHFSHVKFNLGSPPDWMQNPTNGRRYANPGQHWSRLNEFDPGMGDIKQFWEASRFDWALILARAFRLTGDLRFLDGLNSWISDWTMKNPLNSGPNWKCGQEAGIRMLQVLLCAFLLHQLDQPSVGLVRFVTEHCRRIEPTIRYAISQDNNHGTSEAAALYVGGGWLERVSGDKVLRNQALRWKSKGRRWLENRVCRLVEKDGSFSQYSLNYHRVLLDTLNMVEFWRREFEQEKLSEAFYLRARSAVDWLYQMVDSTSGDAPNLGANDGARLFVLSSTDYRDFRPSIQLGASLFCGGKILPSGPWDDPLAWLELDAQEKKEVMKAKESRHYPDGGYVVFRPQEADNTQTWGVLCYPKYRFRPGHADGLHLDLWHQGVNVLRDSGSFSYNAEEPWKSYFSSTQAHNTVQFDGRDQMPRISRFLWGNWLKMASVGDLVSRNGALSWAGAYVDYQGCRHQRTVIAEGQHWQIVDEIDGFGSSAVLRWRLVPDHWQIQGTKCIGEIAELDIKCNSSMVRFDLIDGWESRCYAQKSKVPIVEVEVKPGKAIITTEIWLKA